MLQTLPSLPCWEIRKGKEASDRTALKMQIFTEPSGLCSGSHIADQFHFSPEIVQKMFLLIPWKNSQWSVERGKNLEITGEGS